MPSVSSADQKNLDELLFHRSNKRHPLTLQVSRALLLSNWETQAPILS